MRFVLKNILQIFLVVFAFVMVKAQPVQINTYGVANLQADTITYYGNSFEKFSPFFKTFRSMIIGGKQQINIYHIGDSHIQADFFSGQTRKDFQSFMTGLEGSRGMVTPYTKGSPDSYSVSFSSGWKSVNILSASDSQHKSLWGTSVYTNLNNQSINIKVNNRNPIKYEFNSFRVYHSDLQAEDKIYIDDLNVAYSRQYNKEYGYTEFKLSDYITEVKIVVDKKSSDSFYIYGFYFDNKFAGVVYNATGTNGATAAHYNNNANLLTKHLSSLKANLVIISLGTNDTYESGGENTFETNLTNLVSNIRKSHKDIPILLTTPTECYWHKKYPNPRMKTTVDIIKNVAKKNDCAVLDIYNILGGQGSAKKMKNNSLMQNDMVHLSVKGYGLIGDLLYNALWQEIENNLGK